MWQAWIHEQWKKRGWWSLLFRPLSVLYGWVVQINRRLKSRQSMRGARLPVPVVVVGNIYVGGTGKTPVILETIEALRRHGWRPGLISRGYGAEKTAVPLCGRGLLSAAQFGDEPAMISQRTNVPVARHAKRAQAARALLNFDPSVDVILSDDGLQHWRLHRDVELLVEDERGLGNGLMLPAGPLREPATRRLEVQAILKRTTPEGLVSTRIRNGQIQTSFTLEISCIRHLLTGQSVAVQAFSSWRQAHSDLLVMAGIGVPQRFFAQVRELGLQPTRTQALSDHADIDLAWLSRQPERTILMTEKDAIKLGTLPWAEQPGDASDCALAHENQDLLAVRERIWVAQATVRWHDQVLFDWLDARLHDLRRELQ